ncbi:MAG: type II secretion system F family protein [Labilithrix sp.]|nr:type II secretion system F family protein [Labilithrix sp.]MBX3220305.1 type II secretion system F family protein [Labilithrix sp.]
MSTLSLLRSGLVAAVFVSLFVFGALAGAAPMPPGGRTGIRGLKRQRALAKGNGWANVEPALRWLGGRVGRFVSPQLLRSIDRQISMAGDYLGLYAEELVGLSVLTAIVGLVAGGLANAVVKIGPMFVVGVGAFGAVAPFMMLSSAASDRLKAIARRLPPAIDLLALGMGAGLDFPGALRQTVERSGTPDDPLIEELSLILVSFSLGRTRREALEELAERAPIPMVQEFVGAVVQAELRGNPVADVLQIQAEVSRQKRSILGEEAAAKAGVSMIGPLVLLFVAILILIVAPMVIKLSQQSV